MEAENRFTNLTAWFSRSTPEHIIRKWETHGGRITEEVSDATHLFTNELNADETKSTYEIRGSGLLFFKPEWIENVINDSISSIENYILLQETSGRQILTEEREKAKVDERWKLFEQEIKNLQTKTVPVDSTNYNLRSPRKQDSGSSPSEHVVESGKSDKVLNKESDSTRMANKRKIEKQSSKDIECKRSTREKTLNGFLYGSFEDFTHINDLVLPMMQLEDFVANKYGCQVKLKKK